MNPVAERIWATPVRLLAALALTLVIIAGLLAMHAMSGVGHGAAQPLGTTVVEHSSSAHAIGELTGDSAAAQVSNPNHAAALTTHPVSSEHPERSAPIDSGHTMLLMACALALLVALLLLPSPSWLAWRELAPMRVHATAGRGPITSRQRPSLIFLSISRT